jgi:hypothetical protein
MESRVVDGPLVSTFAFVNPAPLPAEATLQDLLGGNGEREILQLIDGYLRSGYSNTRVYSEAFVGDVSDHPEFLAALVAHRAAYFADVPVQEPTQSGEMPPPSFVGQWIELITPVP